jgi:hypothetical protein
MRNIISEKKKDAKKSRNRLIIGIILIAVMALGYGSFSSVMDNPSSTTKINYNGISFLFGTNRLWNFELGNSIFTTSYSPLEVQNISFNLVKSLSEYSGKKLYLVGGSTGRSEILRNLDPRYNQNSGLIAIQDGCISGYENLCSEDAPVKDCDKDEVIIIQESENITIKSEGKCVFISSPYDEEDRAVDAFMYKILGVN